MTNRILLVLCFFSLFSSILLAQTPCAGTAIPSAAYTTLKSDLSKGLSSASELELAKGKLKMYCFQSWQIKELASLIDNDGDRLQFAEWAYPRVSDPDNFYDVYDAFYYMSNAMRLRDFIEKSSIAGTPTSSSLPGGTDPGSTLPPTPPAPSISYPDPRFYFGDKGCSSYMDRSSFESFLTGLKAQTTDLARYNYLKVSLNGKNLSMEQLMLFCQELSSNDYRLDILKTYSPKTYDRGNFHYAEQILSPAAYQSDYASYMNLALAPPVVLPSGPAPVVDSFATCRVSDADFAIMKSSISGLSFSSAKESQAKTIIKSHCFTAAQIKALMQLMSFEDSRLHIAEFAYGYCLDKKNYFVVNDAFSFSSSVEELNKYLSAH